MAGSINKAILIGHLGRDPEIRTMNSGDRVANITLATSESWRDKMSGERKERTEWHRIVIWNDGLARIAEQYLRKGSKIYIEGRLETRKWTDQSGQEKYSTEVVLRPFSGNLTLLDKASGSDSADPAPSSSARATDARGRSTDQPAQNFDFDDEIPF